MEYNRINGTELQEVIHHQPRSIQASIAISNQRSASYVDTCSKEHSGCCVDIWEFVGVCLACLICPPFTFLGFFLYPCCSFKGRSTFFRYLRGCYLDCCCRIDCITPISLYDAVSRYEEDAPLKPMELINSIISNKFVVSILETLNVKLPNFFFTYLPSGSLREGLGKVLPSSSSLASDFDIMLIPDAVTIGEIGQRYEQAPVFRVVRSSHKEHPDGYLWLKLDDLYLSQWESLCLRRHIKDDGCSLLSSTNIHEVIRKSVMGSMQLQSTVKHFGADWKDTVLTVERHGPALNLKVRTVKKSKTTFFGCTCCKVEQKRTLFDADFTIALHCCFWPNEAKGFFDAAEREHWPGNDAVVTIKRLGCHVVPKQSTNALVKLTLEQAEYTTYGRSPGLEWRYSFSQAEMILSDNLPPPARTAYLALKAINKRHLDRKGHSMGSYALKCILFRLVESKTPEFWQGETSLVVESIFVDMLNTLTECFEQQNCPNYWIPEINLLAGLTEYDIVRKQKLMVKILQAPKEYVADKWLEYTRCLRLNCCYCGDAGIIPQLLDTGEIADTPYPEECCCVGSLCTCTYDQNTCPCGPCTYDRLEFDVY